jgi:hypothetical protein
LRIIENSQIPRRAAVSPDRRLSYRAFRPPGIIESDGSGRSARAITFISRLKMLSASAYHYVQPSRHI